KAVELADRAAPVAHPTGPVEPARLGLPAGELEVGLLVDVLEHGVVDRDAAELEEPPVGGERVGPHVLVTHLEDAIAELGRLTTTLADRRLPPVGHERRARAEAARLPGRAAPGATCGQRGDAGVAPVAQHVHEARL